MKSVDRLRGDDASLGDLERRLSAITGCGFIGDALNVIADEIEAEIKERYMLLPVDRSGETWRIGDKFAFAGADGREHICTVSGVSDCEVFFYYDEHSSSTKHRHFTARAIAHVKPRTLENMLCDLANEVWEASITCQTTWSDSGLDGIEKRYADEIRELLGGAE